MEKCPNCGSKVGSKWPLVVMGAAFFVVLMLWKHDPFRKYNRAGDLAILVFLIGSTAVGVIDRARTYDLKSPGNPQSTIDR
jgi:hypothetical protein